MSPRWWSQPFAPEGSAAAEGITKQLGRPALDPLTILVREAAQNSWDARRPGVVDFSVKITTLGERAGAWQETFLPEPSAEAEMHLADHLRPDSLLIVISDRNTVGLGGPLRAGERAGVDEHADFVQFLRNVGEPSDHKFGGGTYGFGKGIFYRLSGAGSVLVSTQTSTSRGADRRRLMGAALGHSWYRGDRRFTGRHWWGDVGADDIPDPLLGDEADRLAARLGLPRFGPEETGTDIIVIGADLGTNAGGRGDTARTPQEAATFLGSSILWHLWPKFVPNDVGDCMRFSVGAGEAPTPLPSPIELAEFEPFVEALTKVRTGGGQHYTRTVPPKDAGSVHLQRCLNEADRSSRLLVTAARPFTGVLRHVARMRTPELIVDYLEGPPHPDPRFAYAGVFKASPDADTIFAESEPPTHDAWISSGLSGAARGVVANLNSRIVKMIDQELGTAAGSGNSDVQGLGNFSMRLASLMPGRSDSNTPRGSRDGGGGGGGGGRRSGRSTSPRLVGRPLLRVHHGEPFLAAKVLVPESAEARILSAEVMVVVENGGAESDRPLGAITPVINQWQSANGGSVIRGNELYVPAGAESEWWVYATHVPDAVVRFRVSQGQIRAR